MSAGIIAQTTVVVAVVLVIGWLGRLLARLLRQPTVMGELAAGLLAVPILLAATNRHVLDVLLPAKVVSNLGILGNAGLALFLVGVAHELRGSLIGTRISSLGWVTAGALIPPLASGVVVAGWLLTEHDPTLRGNAPVAAFILVLAVSLAITAVPVLARILADRKLTTSLPGRLSLSAAAVVDAVAWPLLAVAIGLASGQLSSAGVASLTLLAGAGLSIGVRRVLRTEAAGRFVDQYPVVVAVLIGIAAIASANLVSTLGLSPVFGAFLVGLAVPGNKPPAKQTDLSVEERPVGWRLPVHWVTRLGLVFVPVFFVATGLEVFAKPFPGIPWLAIGVVTALAMLGKLGGGYAGTRLAGYSRITSVRVGALLNTRGLTEIVALQAGFHAGILTASMFLVCLVMTLVTTCATGPLMTWTNLGSPGLAMAGPGRTATAGSGRRRP
ncbi:MAG TPA: cation:proton antiporter [Pseudonocardiaceae bacterium]|nr:cation:proton antiporter [Pseudonocardiaceae bacterium]